MQMKERGNGLYIPDTVTGQSVTTDRDKLIMVDSLQSLI